ncbi:MAG: carboxypeptidase-like regulatory domain-containing protein [Granulicella sp.]
MRVSEIAKWLKASLILGMVLISAPAGLGQGQVGGRISGRVTDPSDAVVPNARISAKNGDTNVVIKSQSNNSGYYTMQVPAGKYTITVSAEGFGTVVLTNRVVLVGSDVGGDVHLSIATTASVVEVRGDASQELITPSSSQTQTSVAYNWQLPVGKGKLLNLNNSIVGSVLGGWTTSGVITLKAGTPITVTTESSLPGIGTVLPNIVSGQPLLSANAGRGKFNPSVAGQNVYLNPAAFAIPPAFTFGTAPRYFDSARTFGYEDWDVALTKRWDIEKRFHFDLKYEAFNVTNRTNFAGPNADIQSPAFGKITAIQSNTTPRNGQVSGTISW